MLKAGNIRIGTWNLRSLKGEVKKQQLADDIQGKQVTVTAVQETHLSGTGVEVLKSTSGERYNLYYTGDDGGRGGVGIITKADDRVNFHRLTDRICKVELMLEEQRKLVVISTYAPTNPVCIKDPNKREDYYADLDRAIKAVSKRSILVVAGDFNAKTGSAHKNYPTNVGKYGKGKVNENGERLVELANEHDLVLTNTKFHHKLLHRTTWESPFRKYQMANGEERRNPQRNQIDYIMVRKQNIAQIKNSRSYPHGNTIVSDHRPVIMDMDTKVNIYNKVKPAKVFNFEKLRDKNTQEKYAKEVDNIMKEKKESPQNTQERWNNIVNANKVAAKNILGYRERKAKSDNTEIIRLSNEQKELNNKLNTETDQQKREEIRKSRNSKLNEIHQLKAEENNKKIIEQIEEIEKSKEDSHRMFKAVKVLKNNEKRKPLMVQGESGLTSNPEAQVKIVAEYFNSTFTEKDLEEIADIPPTPIEPPFTEEEIKSAIKTLKDNKSPGIDTIRAEQLKSGGSEVNKEIANILNETSKTGKYPEELKEGILTPLQKPGKARGPPSNLRPIILLSALRKILAICMIRRIGKKIDGKIPTEQAAYRAGRGTTEHAFAYKLLVEKAITSKNYATDITLMDMSKAFDTVRRGRLIEDLKSILTEGELHIIKIMVEDVKLRVRIDQALSDPFTTKMGVPQGDCLSPILFTLYLARALHVPQQTEDHNYYQKITETPDTQQIPALRDHTYTPRDQGVLIRPKYADDIGWGAANCKHRLETEREQTLPKLRARGLRINEAKTEEFTIRKNGPDDWKKCKILGSLLDTNEDIKRRKQLANNAMQKLKHIFENNRLKNNIKLRIFRACVESIFLYNSELWTITKTIENRIDSYQRRLQRRAINIKWPKKISSERLYEITKQRKWSESIKTRRIRWFGHAVRLHSETPAKQALEEARRSVKKLKGGQTTTWMKTLEKDLKGLDMTIDEATEKAKNRKEWKIVVGKTRAPRAPALRA